LRLGWSSVSLLAHMSMMVAADLVGPRTIRMCGRCHKYFMGNAHEARYCSTRCKNTMRKRRQRAPKSWRSVSLAKRSIRAVLHGNQPHTANRTMRSPLCTGHSGIRTCKTSAGVAVTELAQCQAQG